MDAARKYEPRYSGQERSGICVCGHSWEDHHLGVVFNDEYVLDTGEHYMPQECENWCSCRYYQDDNMKQDSV